MTEGVVVLDAFAALLDLGLEAIDADWDLARAAATFKRQGGISYADCFAAALARHEARVVPTCPGWPPGLRPRFFFFACRGATSDPSDDGGFEEFRLRLSHYVLGNTRA